MLDESVMLLRAGLRWDQVHTTGAWRDDGSDSEWPKCFSPQANLSDNGVSDGVRCGAVLLLWTSDGKKVVRG